MEKILENLWVLFIGIMSWIMTRMFSKIDDLEKDKADAKNTREDIPGEPMRLIGGLTKFNTPQSQDKNIKQM